VRFGEDFEGFAVAAKRERWRILPWLSTRAAFDFFFVEIQTGECHNSLLLLSTFAAFFRTARKVDG